MRRFGLFVIPLALIGACTKPEPDGLQYNYSAEFLASLRQAKRRIAFIDSMGNLRDSLKLSGQDSIVAKPAAGSPGYTFYSVTFRVKGDSTANDDSLGFFEGDTTISWRTLPFSNALAGSFFPGPEEVLYFHINGLVVGDQVENLYYRTDTTAQHPTLGSLAVRVYTRRPPYANDTLGTRELWWNPSQGIIYTRLWNGHGFYFR